MGRLPPGNSMIFLVEDEEQSLSNVGGRGSVMKVVEFGVTGSCWLPLQTKSKMSSVLEVLAVKKSEWKMIFRVISSTWQFKSEQEKFKDSSHNI